jgi:hypothetical protein
MPHELRPLERLARAQAALTGEARAKQALLEVAEEYRNWADWKEANLR